MVIRETGQMPKIQDFPGKNEEMNTLELTISNCCVGVKIKFFLLKKFGCQVKLLMAFWTLEFFKFRNFLIFLLSVETFAWLSKEAKSHRHSAKNTGNLF